MNLRVAVIGLGRMGKLHARVLNEMEKIKLVCVVDTDRSSEPAYLEGSNSKEFHVRVGNTTRIRDSEEAVNYTQINWE